MKKNTPTRKCWICQENKSLEAFHRDKRDKKHGRQKRCRVCSKKVNKEWAGKNAEYRTEKRKERYQREKHMNKERYKRNKEKMDAYSQSYRSSKRGRIGTLLSSARHRAQAKSYDYDLDREWLSSLWEEQEGCCALTGIAFNMASGGRPEGVRTYRPFSPSLDRIDPTKGYTQDNVRIICTVMNLALNRFGEEVFKTVAEAYLSKRQ